MLAVPLPQHRAVAYVRLAPPGQENRHGTHFCTIAGHSDRRDSAGVLPGGQYDQADNLRDHSCRGSHHIVQVYFGDSVMYTFIVDNTRAANGNWRFGWLALDGVPIQAMMSPYVLDYVIPLVVP